MKIENLEKVKKLYDEREQIKKTLAVLEDRQAEKLEIMVGLKNNLLCVPCSSTVLATMSIENQVPYLKRALEQRLEDIYIKLETL